MVQIKNFMDMLSLYNIDMTLTLHLITEAMECTKILSGRTCTAKQE